MALAVALLVPVACSPGGDVAQAPASVPAASVPANPPRPADCAPAPAADPTTAEGWLGITAATPDDVGLVVDDGRGAVVSHAPGAQMPIASAAKVVHVAAYGRAVAEGRLRPDEQVRVGDWENWYLAADAGAHVGALDALGIPRDGLQGALDPNRTVTLQQVVAAMVQFSDNAAADLLRDRLGDQELVGAAASGGWRDLDLPSELGAQLALVRPQEAPPLSAPRSVRGPAELAMAQRFASDPAYREDSRRRLAARAEDIEAFLLESERWARSTSTGSAAQLAGLWRAVISGSFGPGADVARAELEPDAPRPDGQVRAIKGGSFPGIGTMALSVRRPDGTIGIGVLLGRGFAPGTALDEVATGQLRLLVQAVEGPAARSRVLCAA
ncbi:serine hydrolase [Actinomycetospora lutea]|uniref:serine hydrolase n=1 Tax=Actinomycetospora lutea TaxID=663604 RepID=UPI002366C6BB|nr:serine hydrolase [Actinomycetospora lutea]MDD7941702.1 serine hydrolase [Actinomycetospora lutea]